MASGDVVVKPAGDLPRGWAETVSGRLSGVTEPGELSVHYPFPNYQLATLDDALTYGSRQSKARFSVYIGDLGNDTNAGAREVFLKVPTPDEAVLIAVSRTSTSSRLCTARHSRDVAPSRPLTLV